MLKLVSKGRWACNKKEAVHYFNLAMWRLGIVSIDFKFSCEKAIWSKWLLTDGYKTWPPK